MVHKYALDQFVFPIKNGESPYLKSPFYDPFEAPEVRTKAAVKKKNVYIGRYLMSIQVSCFLEPY